MDLLLLALLVALAVWSARKARRWWARRAVDKLRLTTPGFSADNPLVVTRPKELDDALSSIRCFKCGGSVKPLGETPRLGLRVARGQCVDCEEDVDFYFVTKQLLN